MKEQSVRDNNYTLSANENVDKGIIDIILEGQIDALPWIAEGYHVLT